MDSILLDTSSHRGAPSRGGTRQDCPLLKKRRTKAMHFSSRRTVLSASSANYTRLLSSLNDCDVFIESSFGGAHLRKPHPGNKRYLATLQQHQVAYSHAIDKRAVVERVAEKVRPGRFVAKNFGPMLWLETNRSDVLRMIRNDLQHLVLDQARADSMRAKLEAQAAAIRSKQVNAIEKNEKESEARVSAKANTLPMKNKSSISKITSIGNRKENHGLSTEFWPPGVALVSKSCNLLKHWSLEAEHKKLSDYNRLLLEGIELFQADEKAAKGRIAYGQLGFRCVFCRNSTKKNKGSQSFPGRPEVMEFNCYLIGNKHLLGNDLSTACPNIPGEERVRLMNADRKGNGLQWYFSQVVQCRGIMNSPTGGLMMANVELVGNGTPTEDTSYVNTVQRLDQQEEEAGDPNHEVLLHTSQSINNAKSKLLLCDALTDVARANKGMNDGKENANISATKRLSAKPNKMGKNYGAKAGTEGIDEYKNYSTPFAEKPLTILGNDQDTRIATFHFDLPSLFNERSKLSTYNAMLLDQCELFCATEEDIVAFPRSCRMTGQVGLRCLHCHKATFPGRAAVLHHGLHHLAKTHILDESKFCTQMSKTSRIKIYQARSLSKSQSNTPGATNIQTYIMEVARRLGIVDMEGGGLRLQNFGVA